jgi:hypothetical protein
MKKLAALLALYFAQGLPFGVQATALPLMLRERGASLETIGFASVLALPWLAKALWAPLVDRYGSARFGRRKSWIVPMQLCLALAALLASRTDDPLALAGIVLIMNFFAATQDIAVDGLAVSWLADDELGPGNAVQVVGYKLGMLTGGGLLVWASAQIGFSFVFMAMAVLMLGVATCALFIDERGDAAAAVVRAEPPLRFGAIARRLGQALAQPAGRAVVLVIVTYKLGESLADGMWKPMLLDRGFSVAQIGLWAGGFGLTCSLVGSSLSGLMLRRWSLTGVLTGVATARALGLAGQWWISGEPAATSLAVIVVTCVEHLAGGALTTVVFALMMRHTDRQIGATQFTLLASIEVFGKLLPSMLSGVVAAQLGYVQLFGLAVGLSIAFVLLVRALRGSLHTA